jgi:propionate CoA-transferase
VATGGFVGVTRYTTSAFVHAKLGAALRDSDIPAHIFDSASEAQARLAELVREPRGR